MIGGVLFHVAPIADAPGEWRVSIYTGTEPGAPAPLAGILYVKSALVQMLRGAVDELGPVLMPDTQFHWTGEPVLPYPLPKAFKRLIPLLRALGSTR